jgi:rare lipoprotein A
MTLRYRSTSKLDCRRTGLALTVAALAVLAGCASVSSPGRDGPAASPPADLASTPNAEPRVEPIRAGGPNKPYEIGGRSYTPQTRDAPFSERGLASWYGRKFHGRPTASGELYDMHAMTAAHPTMPLPSYARVRNPANGREVVVRVNDRGPFHPGRIIDLSHTAALKLGVLNGVAPVEVERLTNDEIRTGAWRHEGDTRTAAAAAAEPPRADMAAPGPVQLEAPPSPGAVAAAPATPEPVAADATPATATPAAAAAASGPSPNPDATAPAPPRAYAGAARGFWVQLGAFRQLGGAEDSQQRVARELDWLAPLLAVFSDAPLHRLQAGPYPTRAEASAVAARVRDALKLVPLVVERR